MKTAVIVVVVVIATGVTVYYVARRRSAKNSVVPQGGGALFHFPNGAPQNQAGPYGVRGAQPGAPIAGQPDSTAQTIAAAGAVANTFITQGLPVLSSLFSSDDAPGGNVDQSDPWGTGLSDVWYGGAELDTP